MESSVKALSKYRFESSQEALVDAKLMFENGRYKNALNRAYYAIFHAVRAVNSLEGFDSSKHSGVIDPASYCGSWSDYFCMWTFG